MPVEFCLHLVGKGMKSLTFGKKWNDFVAYGKRRWNLMNAISLQGYINSRMGQTEISEQARQRMKAHRIRVKQNLVEHA